MKNSLRKANDGVSIFGYLTKNSEANKFLDFELNIPEEKEILNTSTETFDKPSPIKFFIYFNKQDKKYYIRSYKTKSLNVNLMLPSVIVQISKPYVLF